MASDRQSTRTLVARMCEAQNKEREVANTNDLMQNETLQAELDQASMQLASVINFKKACSESDGPHMMAHMHSVLQCAALALLVYMCTAASNKPRFAKPGCG